MSSNKIQKVNPQPSDPSKLPDEQVKPVTVKKNAQEAAIAKSEPSTVAQASDEQELQTESAKQRSQTPDDITVAQRLGIQMALAERQSEEVAYAAYQQTKAQIEQELGQAPQIFRRYQDFKRIDLNGIAAQQLGAVGFDFSPNAGLSALADRLLGSQDSAA